MPNVSLTPELERFAESCVQSGRYNSVSEVTRAALRLLQQVEQQRREFLASLDAAEAEGDGNRPGASPPHGPGQSGCLSGG